ncbi:MAG: alpha-glucan family phosphorylase, partial [Prevotella sp.]|nr:alpha-glucan family phosphorylase [Prevotella sp.]
SLFGKYMSGYAQLLGISWDEFIGMGRENPDNHDERFCMSVFACNTCQEVNGVSRLHGWVSQKMFAPIWKGYYPEENHVGYVTNGVHFPTWTATEWRKVYDEYFDKNFMHDQSNESIWHAINNVPNEEVWKTRMTLKKKLIKYIKTEFTDTWLKNQGDPSRVVSILEKITPNALMIGFCRRFATYKRAHLLFTDLDRLSKIVNNPERPVLFFFSGKAHPADGAGQGLIKRIYEISQRPEFLGKIIFLENYDMDLARRLVSGVDIWMNTPTRPLEASGTSGEKAEMNGVVNLSVLDGWWVEGYREGAGWALDEKRTYENQEYQDKLDAATIYGLLENEIVPMYYAKNENGYSEEWLKVIKKSISTIAPHYTMKRQLDDYFSKFYVRMAERSAKLSADNNALAKSIATWKETVAERWEGIHVVSKDTAFLDNGGETGVNYSIKYVIDEQGLNDAVGLELVVLKNNLSGSDKEIHSVYEFKVIGQEGNLYTFEANIEPATAGSYRTAVRMFPKNENLPHRQDFSYVKWLD